MAHSYVDTSNEITRMRPAGKMLGVALMAGGLVAIIAAFALGGSDSHRRFWFAYMFGFCSITAVSCGSLVFLLINYLVRAGWITNVRRILETMALQMVLVLLLALPIIGVTFLNGTGSGQPGAAKDPKNFTPTLYSWARPTDTQVVTPEEPADVDPHETGKAEVGKVETAKGEGAATAEPVAVENAKTVDIPYPNEQARPGIQRDYNENIAHKARFWLNPTVWTLRVLAYFVIMAGIAWYYWSASVKQDATGDLDISDHLFKISGPMLITAAFLTTFISFDVFMSLDPLWFSTMFGVYYFASGVQAVWAIVALFVLVLQWRGYLTASISREHRHDLGKWLWAFIFFWGYIGFDQYMLQWYANLPEETFWFDKRGYSMAHPNAYSPLVLGLLIGRFIIPFLGLVSRHVKRNRFGLGFWAVWLLVFFVVDMYHIVIPEHVWVDRGQMIPLGVEALAFIGIGGLWLGNVIRVLGSHELRAVRDPRVHESLALQNF